MTDEFTFRSLQQLDFFGSYGLIGLGAGISSKQNDSSKDVSTLIRSDSLGYSIKRHVKIQCCILDSYVIANLMEINSRLDW